MSGDLMHPDRRGRSRRREDLERDRLFELTRDMLCVSGFDGVFRQVNPAFERALGHTLAELKSKPFIEFVMPEDRERSLEEFRRVRGGAETVTFENRFLHADGSYRWLQWNATTDPEHEVIYGVARDITERKSQEAELARLASVVASSNDAIIGMSLHGVVEHWNPAAEDIFGYPGYEMHDKPLSLLIPPGHVDHLPQILDSIRRGQRIAHYETIRRRKDGAVINVSLTVSPVRDAAGHITGASAVARDITDRKQAEAERLALMQKLEHALARTKRMTGGLPVCTSCKRVRDDRGFWHEVMDFIADHSDAKPVPALCESCAERTGASGPLSTNA
ncbi:MAG: PAS domain S-box protein [Gemmatimonadota bacterium]